MKEIIAESGQTVFDIATQEMGSVQGVFDILDANAFLRIDQSIPAGTVVLVPDTVINAGIVDYYTRNNIKPVSGLGEEITLNQEEMINITQDVAYDLSDGNTSFDGVRLANMGDELSVQINYTDLDGDVIVYVEQSLDGTNFSAIEQANYHLVEGDTVHTFNINALVTNFARIRVEISGSATGTVDTIIYRQ